MAKRKAAKPALPPKSDVVELTVTWRNTFNCDRSELQKLDRKVAASIARQAGYDFMAHNHVVFLLHPEEGPEALGKDAESLDAGLLVRTTSDKKLLDVRPVDKKKYVVMAASYSYNDEWHSREEGGTPESVFDTQEEADREADRRNIKARVENGTPFEYLGEGEDEYDKCISMPYPQWFDWLKDRDIDPPTDDPDEEPSRERLEGWWDEGVGGREWGYNGYRNLPGKWSDAQKQAAAEYVSVDFYEVVPVAYGAE